MPLPVLLVTHCSCCDCSQSVFIVFQDKIRPGKNYTGSQLFDNGGAFYNVPGYLDNLKVGSIRQLDFPKSLLSLSFAPLLSAQMQS